MLERQASLTYRPIDISADVLAESALTLAGAYSAVRIEAYAGDYFPLLRAKRLQLRDRALALFLGSNIGNFEPDDARELLHLLARALRPGDALLIGYDLKKDASILELAYDDPTGVTSAFNKNLLARINRELGGDFDLGAFRFEARWNDASGAVESFLVSERAQHVRIAAARLFVPFAAGDAIHTESSYKFAREDLLALANGAGFDETRTYTDAGGRYALSLLNVR